MRGWVLKKVLHVPPQRSKLSCSDERPCPRCVARGISCVEAPPRRFVFVHTSSLLGVLCPCSCKCVHVYAHLCVCILLRVCMFSAGLSLGLWWVCHVSHYLVPLWADLGTEQNAHPHLFLRESWIRWWGLVATNPPTKDHTPGRVVMIG